MPPRSAVIGTTSEQAYDPSAELYDYAQTKAATMNYINHLESNLLQKVFGLMVLHPDQFGHLCR